MKAAKTGPAVVRACLESPGVTSVSVAPGDGGASSGQYQAGS